MDSLLLADRNTDSESLCLIVLCSVTTQTWKWDPIEFSGKKRVERNFWIKDVVFVAFARFQHQSKKGLRSIVLSKLPLWIEDAIGMRNFFTALPLFKDDHFKVLCVRDAPVLGQTFAVNKSPHLVSQAQCVEESGAAAECGVAQGATGLQPLGGRVARVAPRSVDGAQELPRGRTAVNRHQRSHVVLLHFALSFLLCHVTCQMKTVG